MDNHISLGKSGEELASSYLENQGYEILHRNWRFRKLEIDIIARKGNELVVVEVKTRTNEVRKVEDVLSVDKGKKLVRACHHYLEGLKNEACGRIDLIVLSKKKSGFDITHIKDAIGQE